MAEQKDIETLAAQIPSMGGRAIGPSLRAAAAAVPEGSEIVEIGAWLGAGTAQLALGALNAPHSTRIHSFDRFTASEAEVTKAAAQGVTLATGQNTLPVVKRHLAAFDTPITFHRGSVMAKRWTGGPIGLHVDDAAKLADVFFYVLRTFGPSWIPGQTAVVLMDFNMWKKTSDPEELAKLRAQHDFIEAHKSSFEPLPDADPAGTSAAFFRYAEPLDFDAIPRPNVPFLRQLGYAIRRRF